MGLGTNMKQSPQQATFLSVMLKTNININYTFNYYLQKALKEIVLLYNT